MSVWLPLSGQLKKTDNRRRTATLILIAMTTERHYVSIVERFATS